MTDYKKYKPATAFSIKGRILLRLIRFAFWVRKILGLPQWSNAIPLFHEDPLKMTFAEKLYLGYKYYYKALVKPEANSGLENYFANQALEIKIPEDFLPEQTITLSAGGDLIPYDCIIPKNCENLWDEAGDFFFDNDLVFTNLETVADPSKPYSAAPEIMLHDMFFNIHEESFAIFSGNGKYRGYDVLSIANNHTLDCGPASIEATQTFLSSKNISFTGSALSAEKINDFPILERSGIKIAFLAYTYSLNKETLPIEKAWLCNHLNLNDEFPDIELIKHQARVAKQRGADFIVASLHAGCAYQAYPSQHIVKTMHCICDETGIDLLIGGHPHNAQPMEIYTSKQSNISKQHFIIYSLGDFISYDIFKWCHLPLLLRLSISKGMINGHTITILSKIEVKAFYMHRNNDGHLILKDFIKLQNGNELENFDETAKKEITELADFFTRFIITEKQAHILA